MKRLGRPLVPLSGLSLLLSACSNPLHPPTAAEQVATSHYLLRQAVQHAQHIQLSRPASEVDAELPEHRRAELDALAGPATYRDRSPTLGPDLTGQTDTPTLTLPLQQAIQLAVKNNLDIQIARLLPAVSQTQITQAEAAFDAVLFGSADLQRLDQPRPTPSPGGAFLGQKPYQQTDIDSLTTGIRKKLTTGGEIRAQTVLSRTWLNPTSYAVDEYYNAALELSLVQPLLRGFGQDVNRAMILLSHSAHRQALHDLRANLLALLANVEQAYWRLFLARQRLLIQERLLERTIDDYNRIRQREGFDVNPVRKTEAGSFVELRRAEVIRARQEVRNASDALKRLINSPDLPLSGETLILPQDEPADTPITFNLLDALTTALENRPELQKALAQIDDAAVRQRLADNARLPLLNLAATLRYAGLSSSEGRAYDRLTDADFIDYLLSLQFELPLGNRAAEAAWQQRLLERQAAVLAYQRQLHDVVLEVKQAIRDLLTAYELIGAARAARRAAADNLRAIERQEEAGVALTPEFLLDLKLNSQSRLAEAETQEIAALAQYNAAVANFYRAIGTLDRRNGIIFQSR